MCVLESLNIQLTVVVASFNAAASGVTRRPKRRRTALEALTTALLLLYSFLASPIRLKAAGAGPDVGVETHGRLG